MPLAPGLTGRASMLVQASDLAESIGSGDVPVLATPQVVALAERASVDAVTGRLAPGTTTVGSEVQITHIAPTPLGAEVVAEVTLESIDGRRLSFRVAVHDQRGLVAAGRISRVVVDRGRFLERAQG